MSLCLYLCISVAKSEHFPSLPYSVRWPSQSLECGESSWLSVWRVCDSHTCSGNRKTGRRHYRGASCHQWLWLHSVFDSKYVTGHRAKRHVCFMRPGAASLSCTSPAESVLRYTVTLLHGHIDHRQWIMMTVHTQGIGVLVILRDNGNFKNAQKASRKKDVKLIPVIILRL